MHIVVAGGSGFLGRPLVDRLVRDGHDVRVLSRRPASPRDLAWTPDGTTGPWAPTVDRADAVINLAGESIAGGRWTAARKARIRESRILATRSLVNAMHDATRAPAILLSGSAIGYYGARGGEPLTEQAENGADFLAGVCRDWEAEALQAANRTRVVLLRTGIALAKDGGALPQMALPFKLFAGGPAGPGEQYYSWIHREDWVNMVVWALKTGSVRGPLNLTAPNPVPNREFARTLGRVLRRPSFLPAPAFALRAALGEMADTLLLSGQRVVPSVADAQGFRFQYPTLEPALRSIYA